MDCGCIIFGTESYVAFLLIIERFLHLVGPHLKRELHFQKHCNTSTMKNRETPQTLSNRGKALTSLVTPSSSLYPSLSKISSIAVRSFLEQASPRGDRGDTEPLWGRPIRTWDGTCGMNIYLSQHRETWSCFLLMASLTPQCPSEEVSGQWPKTLCLASHELRTGDNEKPGVLALCHRFQRIAHQGKNQLASGDFCL